MLVGGIQAQWRWVGALGVALGVGVQLHAILLVIMPILTLLTLAFLVRERRVTWCRWMVVLVVALLLNVGQILHESETGFANTKTFFSTSGFKTDRTSGALGKNIVLDIACNAQADSHIVSSLGNQQICDFLYSDPTNSFYSTPIEIPSDRTILLGEALSLLFSIVGYGLLIRSFRNEKDAVRKRFLGLILAYAGLFFLVMIPVAAGSRFRYFLPIAFLPFVFLALILDYLDRYMPRGYRWVSFLLLAFLIGTNAWSLRNEAVRLSAVAGKPEKISAPPGRSYIGEITFPYRK